MTQQPLAAMPTRRFALVCALALVACGLLGTPGRANGQALPAAKPEELGLSPAGLAKIGDWMRAEVAAKKIPGATIMIVRDGNLAYAETVGVRDPASGTPLKADDIFRISSMTKPIVSIAAMMLVEEGKLNLDAPVASYIPAFAGVKVGVEAADAIGRKTLQIVEAQRPMTVRDLMRHTSGLTYGFFGTGLVMQAYCDAALTAEGNVDNASFADTIARLPLAYQPGSTWDYSNSTDVLGRVIEVVSGQDFGAFLKTRLFDPLGMKDTSFYVTDAERQARLAEAFPGDSITGNAMFDPRKPAAMESGGGGLMSTAPDYARFVDAAQRRPTRRQALRQRGHAEGHDPRRARPAGAAHRAVPARARLRLRPGLRRAHEAGGAEPRQRGRRVLLGRRRRHLHVGGPGQRSVRGVHDAKPEAARAAPRRAARAGLWGCERRQGGRQPVANAEFSCRPWACAA
jgi:CubicO group peptidase (beta-lactamase class C family)